MTFVKRQEIRKAKREQHQRKMAKNIRIAGGYRSSMWENRNAQLTEHIELVKSRQHLAAKLRKEKHESS